MYTCSPDKCRNVDHIRTRLAIEGYADDTEKCRVCRWVGAYRDLSNEVSQNAEE